jgi:hypothetical protein
MNNADVRLLKYEHKLRLLNNFQCVRRFQVGECGVRARVYDFLLKGPVLSRTFSAGYADSLAVHNNARQRTSMQMLV